MDTEPGEPNRTGGARKANPNAVLAKEKKAATQLGVIVGKKLKKSQTLSAVNGLTLGFCEKKRFLFEFCQESNGKTFNISLQI